MESVAPVEVLFVFLGVDMTKSKEITGLKFGKLTALRPVKEKKYGGTWWLCRCDCGKEKIIEGRNLWDRRTVSCGCSRMKYKKGEAAFNIVMSGIKSSARHRGYEFKLSKEKMREIMKKPCIYCGVLPGTIRTAGKHNGSYIYNGIDRIDNSKGYIVDNCVPCCKICNFAKKGMSYSDFRNWVKKIYDYFIIGNNNNA